MFDEKNIWFAGFHSLCFQIYYLLLLEQELLIIFWPFLCVYFSIGNILVSKALKTICITLTLIWMGFLGVYFEVWGGITFPRLCLKLVRIMLETSNWHWSTQTYLISKNIPFSTKLLLILLMSAFFLQKSGFFSQNSTFTQCNSVRAVLEIF